MTGRRSALCALLMVAALCVGAQADTGPELTVNGDFETGPEVGRGHYRIDPGSQEITGWTVIRGSVDYAGPDWVSPDGIHCLDLEGEAAFGGVAQTIPTIPGQVYTVRFDLAGNTDGDPQIKRMRVQAASQSTERWFDINGRSHEDLGWRTHTWQFVATDETTTIEFVSVEDGAGHCGAMLDNVSVTPAEPWGVRKRFALRDVPEPGPGAVSVERELRLDTPIPIALNGEAGGDKDVVRVNSIKFVLDEGWLQAQVSAKVLSGPKGRWRVVVELRDRSGKVTRRGDVSLENSGIIKGIAMVEDRVLRINLGPWDEESRPTGFRISIENLPPRPESIGRFKILR